MKERFLGDSVAEAEALLQHWGSWPGEQGGEFKPLTNTRIRVKSNPSDTDCQVSANYLLGYRAMITTWLLS